MKDDEESLLDTTSKEESEVAGEPKKKAKAKKMKKASNGAKGRPVSEATTEARKKILSLGKRKDGVTNIEMAEALDVSTAASQSLAKPLVLGGQLKMFKSKENGRVIYKTV
jgi:predicted ArsR family transcriptional regulator